MAHRKMILTAAGAQVYRNRMLRAGDPVDMSAGDARLFAKHGWAKEAGAKARTALEIHSERLGAAAEETLRPLIDTAVLQTEAPKPKRGRRRKA